MPVTIPGIDGQTYLVQARELTDRLLDQHIPGVDVAPSKLHDAMRYSVMAGGKRLRPILALAAFEYCSGDPATAEHTIHKAMAALEMVHTYSLIHDDLPCMDDDDLRRGLPTCHKKYGEAVATLAGDALHVVAFQLMAETGNIQVVLELAEAVGTAGMLGGQMADLEAEGRAVTADEVKNIHLRKTGALIRGSIRVGAILAGANPKLLEKLTNFGESIGLAFQIIDDILDIEGDQALLGKDVGSDTRNQKATYPGVVGLDRARAEANDLIDRALGIFDQKDDSVLKFLATFIGQRNQ